MTQTETTEVSNGAERMRRYRDRKRQGVVCVVQVPVYALDVETLVARNRLEPDDQNDTAKIGEATLMMGKSHRPGLYQGNACRTPFTLTVGTLYERSKDPLHK